MGNKIYFIKFKTLIKMSFILSSIFISLSLFGQAPTNGLILHYTFDKLNGTSIPDSSGNGNAGSLQGAATAVTGLIGQGIQCPAYTDYISLPADFISGLNSFSFSTWVKLNSLKNATRFLT